MHDPHAHFVRCPPRGRSVPSERPGGTEMKERVVMVGAGYWSQFQVEGWRDAGAPLVAIANRHVENAEALAQRYGVPRCYSDIASMLDAERPTLVDVCLPPVAQEPAVRAAIERGIPTICQKPFGIDLKQAEAMTALAEATLEIALAIGELVDDLDPDCTPGDGDGAGLRGQTGEEDPDACGARRDVGETAGPWSHAHL